jgi:aryl-alcohol dehydrogenase-like predicted oxidoreductase
VTCAIPGTTSVAHLEEDFRAGRGRLASAVQRLHIEQDWAAVA